MDEVADVRSGDDSWRIAITVRREPIVFFDNDCAVPVHLRDVCHVTQIPGSGNIGIVVGDGPDRWRIVDAEPDREGVSSPSVAVAEGTGRAIRTRHVVAEVDAELVHPPCDERGALPVVESPQIAPFLIRWAVLEGIVISFDTRLTRRGLRRILTDRDRWTKFVVVRGVAVEVGDKGSVRQLVPDVAAIDHLPREPGK
jgi:hypothetical protein